MACRSSAEFSFDVAQEGGLDLGRLDAAAVVGHLNEIATAAADVNGDCRCAGVDAVLDQFLDRRKRPLDHLAGGDL